jgi:hypothetical protein
MAKAHMGLSGGKGASLAGKAGAELISRPGQDQVTHRL